MAAPLQHEHPPAGLGQPVGDDRPRRPAAHHHRVGGDPLTHLVGGHAAHARSLGRDRARGLGIALALREGLVAHRGERPLVSVVAEVGHLLRETEHRLHQAADDPDPPAGDVAHEALFDKAPPALGAHLGKGRVEEQQGVEPERHERDVHHPLALGAEARHVLVHVARHLPRLELALGEDDLRERGERVERQHVEKATTGSPAL